MTLAAGTPIGKYVVRRKLAEGGMAEIYLAAALGPEGFEKDVVIKRVRPGLAGDPEFVKMFIAEARVASRLNHANLVHIFDFDKHEDTYYLAMEYVRGHSLFELRRRCQERGVAIPADPRRADRHRGRPRARLRPPAHRERTEPRAGPPRRHAAQRAAQLRRGGEADRLRDRQGRRTRHHLRDAQGQVRVHVPGAGPRRRGGRAHRRLRARGDALGAAHRGAAVRGRRRRGGAARGAGAAHRPAGPAQPRPSPRRSTPR